MTDDLVAFMRARLDEERQKAEDALKRMTTTRRWIGGEWVEGKVQSSEWRRSAWPPARGLAEVDAKRRVTEVHHVVSGWQDEDGHDLGDGCAECGHSEEYSDRGGWCETLRLLALPYADHPDYREEWRP